MGNEVGNLISINIKVVQDLLNLLTKFFIFNKIITLVLSSMIIEHY